MVLSADLPNQSAVAQGALESRLEASLSLSWKSVEEWLQLFMV